MPRRTILVCALLAGSIHAQPLLVEYRLGAIRVTEDAATLSVHVPSVPVVRLLPGGLTWPRLALDEKGDMIVGATVIDARRTAAPLPSATDAAALALPNGFRVSADRHGFLVAGADKACLFTQRHFGLYGKKSNVRTLQDGDVQFNASELEPLALATRLDDEGRPSVYAVVAMDLDKCRVSRTELGSRGRFAELGYSRRGGWWVTGPTTMLRSRDGRRWETVPLPAEVPALASGYIVDERQIWLAAMLPGSRPEVPGFIRSADAGAHWQFVRTGDPSLGSLPAGWFEGRCRHARASARQVALR